MIQTSEYCGIGHPDRTCDYIASYTLDRALERDRNARVALEVQLKDAFCTVSGEVTCATPFTDEEIARFCRESVEKIGYTADYQTLFGRENCICGEDLKVTCHISRQSDDIAQGVNADGWGDQGIAWGLAVDEPQMGFMPKDYWLARKIAQHLHSRRFGGLDIKTQVTVEDGVPKECIVAIPIRPECDESASGAVRNYVQSVLGSGCLVIVNGTGRYVKHGSIGDCGTTGRKLVCDFYGGNSRIGGGSPWGKDPTKADVTLNVLARRKALEGMKRYGLELMQCAISCCIGRRDIRVSLFDKENRLVETYTEDNPASHVIASLGLDKPVYADMCASGLFGYEAV